ncbi:MAG: hypothetical protein HY952_09180 [Elusimicrobia bacterium]|nr:hypothetical protein [Elusimicrobiota bacterium]
MKFTFSHNNLNVLDLAKSLKFYEAMGIYFIEDPDGYWLEILPGKRG